MKGGLDVRETGAGLVTGGGESDVQVGGEVDSSQYEPTQPQQQQGEQQQPYQGGQPSAESPGYSYFDEQAAAAAAAEEAARLAAERERQLELENENKHRAKDADIRESELRKQNERQKEDVRYFEWEAPNGVVHNVRFDPDIHTIEENGQVYNKNSGKYLGLEIAPPSMYSSWAQYEELKEARNKEEREARNQQEQFNENENSYSIDNQANELEGASEQYSESREEDFTQGKKKWKSKDSEEYRKAREEYEQVASNVGPTVTDAVRLDAARQRMEAARGNTEPAAPSGETLVSPPTSFKDGEPDQREQAETYFRDYNEFRNKDARSNIMRGYSSWRSAGNEGSLQDYLNSADFQDDPEAFMFTLKSLMSQNYVGLGETEVDAEGNVVPRSDTGIGTKRKETLRRDRLIDNVVRAFKVGFFHITTEYVDTDESTGERSLRWIEPVETRIIRLCDYLGMDRNSVDSHRTVFRLVTLYASMGFDRNGKMFNQDKDEWSLTEREFCDICDMIYQSCIERGHPLAAPFNTSIGRSKLRGTEVIPSGVLPKVVAQAITGPNSHLRIGGIKPSAADLVEACRQEWVAKTYPWVKANLVNQPQHGKKKTKVKKVDLGDGVTLNIDTDEAQEHNLMAQRIAIEDMQQALARLDGMGPEAFSEHYGVDTSLHYKIEEYKNTHVEYAQAMNGLYDAQAVEDYQNELLAEMERQATEQKNSREATAIQFAANIVTTGIKTNALFWNVPIAVSAVAEKAVGDVQTDLAIKSIQRRTERITGSARMDVSQQLRRAFKTDEAHKAIDAALLIQEIAGPQGLALFAKEGVPLTPDNATKFLHDKYIPNAASGAAAKVQELNEKLSKFQQMILTGDLAFNNKDAMNYLNALLVSNQVLIGAQEQLMADGLLDEHAGTALTGAELDDAFLANNGDITRFLAEVIGTAAGRDALIMMRSNNIGNFNPIGYAIDKVLRNHGVTNAMITTFFDSFPKYGINFLYTITPFSRSLTYLEMKRREANGDTTAGMFTMGGGLADVSNAETFKQAYQDPAFKAGLRMNLLFDCMTFGRWSVTTMVLGAVIAALGFEPPDKDEDFLNVSMWKIGGEEIGTAYWLNDLTQLGLPGAYGLAAALSGQDPLTCGKLALSSLYDQVDGNVIIDFIKGVKNWGKELEELEKMGMDPSYISGFSMSYGAMELILSAGDKIVPGAPLYRYVQNDAFLRGDYARAADPYSVYDKSKDWAIDVGKTDEVVDPTERMMRKHSTSNWMLAAYQDFVNGIMFNPDSEKTGYFWWEMPPKDMVGQLYLTWRGEQEMNYEDLEGCKDEESYKQLKTDQLLRQIDKVTEDYGGINQAMMNGYFISHDIRYAALEVLSDRLIQNELEFQAMKDSGVFAPGDEYSSEFVKRMDGEGDFYAALAVKKAVDNEIWDYINILKNPDIPEWYERYEQILSNKDITFTHSDGSPALGWEYLVNGDVSAEWKLKGDHPWALAPITFVDKSSNDIVQRGFSGETVPSWYNEDVTDLQAIINGIGQNVVPLGRNAGEVLNDVLFYRNDNGELVHTDKPTIDTRAYVPVKSKLSDDIKDFDVSAKVKAATDAAKDSNDNTNKNKTKYPTSYPRRTYGKSYSKRGGRSSNYNPKIYSTHAQSTHITNGRANSTRTSPNTRNVNNDRASTMNTPNLQDTRNNTYLRPGFSTKGSREAYKRQDI